MSVGAGCASPQRQWRAWRKLSNNPCINWIQNSELEHFQQGPFRHLGVDVDFVPDVPAQAYLYVFVRLLSIIRL